MKFSNNLDTFFNDSDCSNKVFRLRDFDFFIVILLGCDPLKVWELRFLTYTQIKFKYFISSLLFLLVGVTKNNP